MTRFSMTAAALFGVCATATLGVPRHAAATPKTFLYRIQMAEPTTAAGWMTRAAGLAAASMWKDAADAYSHAAALYGKARNNNAQAGALKKKAFALENYASALLKNVTPAQDPVTPPAPEPTPEPVPQQTPTGAGAMPLERSAIVHKNAKGKLVVASPAGTPVDGIKLSRYDSHVFSPSIAVGRDGTIHVAFIETSSTVPFAPSVYYRSSSNGGHTWSPAKNLSEAHPDWSVGRCQVAVDGADHVYVIWRSAYEQYDPEPMWASALPGGSQNNILYRVRSGGQWNATPINVHLSGSKTDTITALSGSASYFVSTDPNGGVHVIWNTSPYKRHPDLLFNGTMLAPLVQDGDVIEADLNGTTPSEPREVYMTKVSQTQHGPQCEGFDMLEGYVDAAGEAHTVANLIGTIANPELSNQFHLINGTAETPAIEIPGANFLFGMYPPKLLLDAQGRQHLIAMFPQGEHATVRDYLVGSDQEPTIVRETTDVVGKLSGLQAFGGPGGKMVALMQMNDTGKDGQAELYVSTSSGGAWSPAVNVTNNSGRATSAATQTGLHSHVVSTSLWYPGVAAAAYDKTGHLVLVYVSDKHVAAGVTAGGIPILANSSSTPTLLFLRF